MKGQSKREESIFMKYVFNLFAFVSFCLFVWMISLNEFGTSVSAIMMLTVCALLANPEQLESIKIAGLEARLRRTLKDAEVKLTEIQSLAKTIGKILVIQISRTNRLIRDENELLNWIHEIKIQLMKLEISEDECDEMLKEWHRLIERDYVLAILGGGYRETTLALENKKAIQEKDSLVNATLWPSPEELESFMDKYGWLSEVIKERIKDYKFYRENRKHRRPTEWQNHENWRLQ